VGRTDFYPDQAKEVAGLLYDSLRKILQLGDQAILYPAHGAGSVCGSGMANREFSTLGYEREHNPMLQITDRDEFIAQKIGEHHYVPPYFETMERLNLEGASATPDNPRLCPLEVEEVARHREKGAVVVDVRPPEAFCSAHISGSLALSGGMIPAFAGWLLKEDDQLILVADSVEQAADAMKQLARIGFDHVVGYLTGILEWITAGRPFDVVPLVDAETVKRREDEAKDNWTLLDVRGIDEVDDGQIKGSRHVYLGELPERLDEIDPERTYTVMCGSGVRATVAASVLRAQGCKNVDVLLGSMAAWMAKYG
jgi:hydroxyacylglutathione hydrolase